MSTAILERRVHALFERDSTGGVAPMTTAGWIPPSPEEPEAERELSSSSGIDETASNPGTGRILTVLVEDNRADVLIVREAIALYDLPIDLHVLNDGEKAIDYFQHAESEAAAPCPQLLLLDLNLPKKSGAEVLRAVRQGVRCGNIPVVVVTSSDSPRDRNEMAQLGANSYFRKPASYDDFLKLGDVLKSMIGPDRS